MAMNFISSKITMILIIFIIVCSFPISILSVQYSSFRKIQLPSTEMDPESLAFNLLGEGPYTGVSDGRVIKYQALTANFLNFAVTSPRRTSKLCDGTNDINLGPTCGRPLGLGFNQITGQLYINDPFVGLTVVGTTGGLATKLATQAEGLAFKFLVGVDVDPITGLVCFTDVSSIYDPRNATQSIQSGDSTGRLLRYDPKTKQVTVLMRGLAGPVGVAVSKDGTFILVSEFIHKRIQKYWIRGDKANTSEILINFQGNPNKIKRNK